MWEGGLDVPFLFLCCMLLITREIVSSDVDVTAGIILIIGYGFWEFLGPRSLGYICFPLVDGMRYGLLDTSSILLLTRIEIFQPPASLLSCEVGGQPLFFHCFVLHYLFLEVLG